MNLDIDQCTNVSDWWLACGLDTRKHALWHLHHNWPTNYAGQDHWRWMKDQPSWNTAEKIFIVSHEGIIGTDYHRWIADDRVYVWDSLSYRPHDRVHSYLFWFDYVLDVNRQLGALDRLNHDCTSKPYMFECMLGTQKSWRDRIYDQARQHQTILLSYHKKTDWIQGTDLDQDMGPVGGHTQVVFSGHKQCALHMLMPWKIYNSSWFSIISETTIDHAFVSEKTAKPFLGKRLFVWFGVHRGLHHLRNLGFKTFDNIMDESYDDIENNDKRMRCAWQQVEYLLTLDPAWVLDQVRDRLEHNQQLILNMTATQGVMQQIKQLAQGDTT